MARKDRNREPGKESAHRQGVIHRDLKSLASCAHQEGMTATGRADIYSFGIILYEIFTGKVPFTGDSAIAVGFQQMRENPVHPTDVNSKIPAKLEEVILKALQKNPDERYSSVSDMRSDLEVVFSRSSPATAKAERPAAHAAIASRQK